MNSFGYDTKDHTAQGYEQDELDAGHGGEGHEHSGFQVFRPQVFKG